MRGTSLPSTRKSVMGTSTAETGYFSRCRGCCWLPTNDDTSCLCSKEELRDVLLIADVETRLRQGCPGCFCKPDLRWQCCCICARVGPAERLKKRLPDVGIPQGFRCATPVFVVALHFRVSQKPGFFARRGLILTILRRPCRLSLSLPCYVRHGAV